MNRRDPALTMSLLEWGQQESGVGVPEVTCEAATWGLGRPAQGQPEGGPARYSPPRPRGLS